MWYGEQDIIMNYNINLDKYSQSDNTENPV